MSSHDALNDDRLSKEVVVTTEEIEAKQRLREVEEKKKQELKANLASAAASQSAAVDASNVAARIKE